jgi:hypothetical protein
VRRRPLVAVIAVCVLVFLLVSAVLARVFSADSAERSAITSLLRAEARGDADQMVRLIRGCGDSVACRSGVARDATELKQPGNVAILKLDASSSFSLTSTLGTARVAWKVGPSLPIVQCVRVRRAGNAINGLRIELLAISQRIKSDGACPSRI